QQSYLG
ncbi:hypothetical protein D018_4416B, partial [Vibrio parahaemolyticus VP2007-007]